MEGAGMGLSWGNYTPWRGQQSTADFLTPRSVESAVPACVMSTRRWGVVFQAGTGRLRDASADFDQSPGCANFFSMTDSNQELTAFGLLQLQGAASIGSLFASDVDGLCGDAAANGLERA